MNNNDNNINFLLTLDVKLREIMTLTNILTKKKNNWNILLNLLKKLPT